MGHGDNFLPDHSVEYYSSYPVRTFLKANVISILRGALYFNSRRLAIRESRSIIFLFMNTFFI